MNTKLDTKVDNVAWKDPKAGVAASNPDLAFVQELREDYNKQRVKPHALSLRSGPCVMLMKTR